MNTECKDHYKSRAASVEILDTRCHTQAPEENSPAGRPGGTRGEFPCWTPRQPSKCQNSGLSLGVIPRHQRGIPLLDARAAQRGIPLLDAETTKQVPRLSLGVIPRHQRGIPLLDARAAPEGIRQLHIIMWHLTWFFLYFAAWQSLRLSCKIAKRNQVIC